MFLVHTIDAFAGVFAQVRPLLETARQALRELNKASRVVEIEVGDLVELSLPAGLQVGNCASQSLQVPGRL